MDVCAPKDGFVAEVLVKDGDKVEVGAEMLRMDDDEERKQENRLLTMEAVRDIMAERLTGKQLEVNRKLALLALELAEETLKSADLLFKRVKTQVDLGVSENFELLKAVIDRNKATLERDKAKAQLEKFDFTTDASKRVNSSVKGHMAWEKQFLDHQKTLLLVKAPVAGKVSLRVSKGSFAELGSVLAVVE